jgi:hypothetical protein
MIVFWKCAIFQTPSRFTIVNDARDLPVEAGDP